ncbi:hypothetical protein ACFQPF_10070 [Fictibacillus iocasae]|uniref:Uncharacterized protein n=1 Tax=Fictibacillus iocasae TaxID=2715437 RepID=A0ABW2NQB6_9BACL
MNLQDVFYNWLSIKTVAEHRPEDQAAADTLQFFHEILMEDHHVSNIAVSGSEDAYIISYEKDDKHETLTFSKEYIDALYRSIASEPKYNEKPR